jgi:hypothetical protein
VLNPAYRLVCQSFCVDGKELRPLFSGCFLEGMEVSSHQLGVDTTLNWFKAAHFFSAIYPQVFDSHSIIVFEINGMAHNL